MNPEQILAAMAAAYAGCGSYRDAGRVVVRTFPLDGRRPHTSLKPFTTAFVRPDRFRFEFRSRAGEEEWDRCVVWAAGPDVRTWWDIKPGVEKPGSLGMALAGATGVSDGSAHVIPALLMPDVVGGRRLTDLTDVTSLGDELLDGITCYRLQGRFVPYPVDPAAEERRRADFLRVTGRLPEKIEHSPLTVWIDRGTFLVRKVEDHRRFETFRTDVVTTYEPATDVRIADDELGFDPPATDVEP